VSGDDACRVPPPTAPPALTRRAPQRELVRRLAVLRRAQEPGDLLELEPEGFERRYDEIAQPYVRFLGVAPNGERLYLVPVSPRFTPLPRACVRRLSPVRRRAYEAARRRDRVLELGIFSPDGGTGGPATAAELSRRPRVALSDGGGRRAPIARALVPDGVLRVDVRFRTGPVRRARVSDNWWAVAAPLDGDAFPREVVWRDRRGRVVRRFR
jgi:hypothetical protein